MERNVVAIVPMRHSSERVPGKNFREFAGKPLYEHILTTLVSCPSVGRVVIDTDSPIIRDRVAVEYPEVILLRRPDHLTDGKVSMVDVLLHTTGQIEAGLYLQTHSTNPLLSASTIERAIALLAGLYPQYDSLFSVTRVQRRLWDQLARPINHNPSILLRTQDLPPVFEENSCLYLFTRSLIMKRHNRIGERPYMLEIDPTEAWDIDEEADFRTGEMLFLGRTPAQEQR